MTAPKTRKPRSKKLKPISLLEFKAWLEGIEEMQADDWTPDLTQWTTIRHKINSIVAETVEVPVLQPEPQRVYQQPSMLTEPAPQPQPRVQQAPPAFQPPPSTFQPPVADMTPEAAAVLAGKKINPAQLTPDATGKLSTPNIDTSDGNFNSGFE